MNNKQQLIKHIEENGRKESWLSLALLFDIKPGYPDRIREKAANDVWRTYQRKLKRKLNKDLRNIEKLQELTEDFFTAKPSYINKPLTEVIKVIWSQLPQYLLPRTAADIQKQTETIQNIQLVLRKAKVLNTIQTQDQLYNLYKQIAQIEERPKRKLFFDIETSPNIVLSWRIGNKVNLSHDDIIHERAIICVCWKWEDEDEVHSLEWDKGDDKKLLETFSKIIDSADEIVTQNGDRYDIRWLRARCIYHDIPISVKFNSIDTLKMAKSGFYFNSHKLDYMGSYLGVGKKIKTEYDLWKDIVLHNNGEAMKKMVEYCKEDVRVLERVYNKLKPYCPIKKFKYTK